jgi:hypothetical protein
MECQRLAALTPDSERRRALLVLKNAWLQFASELRVTEGRSRLRRWIDRSVGDLANSQKSAVFDVEQNPGFAKTSQTVIRPAGRLSPV